MSFRSRSRTVQPVVHRRSLSGSRLPNALPSYTSNRPMSSAYPSSTAASAYGTSAYISPYSSITSRDSIYGSLQPSRNSYYNSSNLARRDSYNGSSTIYKNPYTSDRYISPYTTYDNGVTTAGLSIKSSTYGTNGYTNKSTYTPLLTNKSTSSSMRHSAKHLSASNSSLNSFSTTASSPTTAASTPTTTTSHATGSSTNLGRSQSFRDQTSERKHRSNLRRNSSLKSERSLSVSSEKSEGYEV